MKTGENGSVEGELKRTRVNMDAETQERVLENPLLFNSISFLLLSPSSLFPHTSLAVAEMSPAASPLRSVQLDVPDQRRAKKAA